MSYNVNGYDFTIMPLDERYVEEICNDIKEQYEKGIAKLALFMMTLVPEGVPPKNKVDGFCRTYDLFRNRLAKMGLECGILVQASIGHGYPLNEMFPFQRYVGRLDGEEKNKVCPYDSDFREYFKGVMRTLAEHEPKAIMIDDDFRLLYFDGKGCACKLHMDRFNELAGTSMSREELNEYIIKYGEDSEYTKLYIETQRESLVGAAKAMREGIDSVDPSIPGMYCTSGKSCEFAADIARELAGKGNPSVVRTYNGVYCPVGTKRFTTPLYRTAEQIAILKKNVDVFLAESDTCPQNRYAMSAQHLHSFLVGAILEGIVGSKRWLTRLTNYEPMSGLAYRKCLAKYSGFYASLKKLVADIKPLGCSIPVFDKPYYSLNESDFKQLSSDGWSAYFLERVGLPMYFSSGEHDVLFLEGDVDSRYSDEEIKELLGGNVVLASNTAKNLNKRGFADLIGVEVSEWRGKAITGEIINFDGNICNAQKNSMELRPIDDSVLVDSYAYHSSDGNITKEILFPASTVYKNRLGGTAIVFSGTPVSKFYYTEGFSFLNETRKRQFVRMLQSIDRLPVYYPEDAEIYMRAGYTSDGKLFVTVFNLGFDILDELPLFVEENVCSVEILCADGSQKNCDFATENNNIIIKTEVKVLDPIVLIISIGGDK